MIFSRAVINGYLALKLLHILLAIVAVGFTTTFGLIMAGSSTEPGAMPHALRTIARLERVAGPSFGGLLVTGLLMGWLGNIGWRTLWFAGSLGVTAVAMGLALGVARPALLKQVALVGSSSPPLEELRRLGARSRAVGMVLSLLSLVLIGLMVFKPTL